jgi:hypothetical protein
MTRDIHVANATANQKILAADICRLLTQIKSTLHIGEPPPQPASRRRTW